MEPDVSTVTRIHFTGIKGVAMTALAIYAKERGMEVTGSDVPDDFPTKHALSMAGIVPLAGFSPGHVTTAAPDLLIHTGAHGGRDNPEVKAAMAAGIPVLPHGKALGLFMAPYRQLSVAGSHGKTTTSAMLATILSQAKKHPSYAIGCGEIFGLGLPGGYGTGDAFVAEADEYVTDPTHDPTPRFLWQSPDILVVTNIDYDHPDAYESLDAVKAAFIALQDRQQGVAVTVVNADDPDSRILLRDGHKTITYGYSPDAEYRISGVGYGEGRTFFEIEHKGKPLGGFSLKVPGRHNVANATAAAIAANVYGLPWDTVRSGLEQFGGTKRRFELVGTTRGISVYDDYAHHPMEIRATLEAARTWYPQHRIIAVFQPHTYSRTKALLREFSESFDRSTVAVISDIYASAREHDTLGITGRTLSDLIAQRHPMAVYAPSCNDVEDVLRKTAREGDVVIFMGAGDIADWSRHCAGIL